MSTYPGARTLQLLALTKIEGTLLHSRRSRSWRRSEDVVNDDDDEGEPGRGHSGRRSFSASSLLMPTRWLSCHVPNLVLHAHRDGTNGYYYYCSVAEIGSSLQTKATSSCRAKGDRSAMSARERERERDRERVCFSAVAPTWRDVSERLRLRWLSYRSRGWRLRRRRRFPPRLLLLLRKTKRQADERAIPPTDHGEVIHLAVRLFSSRTLLLLYDQVDTATLATPHPSSEKK